MKWLAFLVCVGTAAPAQDFVTGQAARLMIGQTTWSAMKSGVSSRILGTPSGLAYSNGTLIVTDANRLGGTPNNNRVLLFGNLGSTIPDLRAELPVTTERCPACLGQATVVLGQTDMEKAETGKTPANNTLRSPIAVATNGRMLAVADTDHNRVLIWRTVPSANNAPADFVIGQPDFATTLAGRSASRLRGPQGVWLDDNNGLWVADTGNSRVLFFGVPSRNGQDATLVLGQPDFNTNNQPVLANQLPAIAANTMLTPMSVTSDGRRLYVADLGLNRVTIWNAIPRSNQQPADIVVGQLDMNGWFANDTSKMCASTGTDKDGKATYPGRCARTLEYPRYALSDGKRLFIADSGNDRILVFHTIPLVNGATADVVLGQQGDLVNQSSESANPERLSASDSLRTPAALAFDGTNLYVTDTFNRRILIFTPADYALPLQAVRNAASEAVYAVGAVTFGGTVNANQELLITIAGKEYKVKTVKDDTLEGIIDKFAGLITAGNDPKVIALANKPLLALMLTARESGPAGNSVSLEVKVTADSATITLTTSGANLSGGQDAARIAPYSLVSILGENFSETTASVPLDKPLPRELAGVQVYFDGFRAPIQFVSPSKIVAQMPAETSDATSANAVVRTIRKDGSVLVSAPVAVLLIGQNPGVFSKPGEDPRPGLAYHYSSYATGTISVDGTAHAGDVAKVVINQNTYTYAVQNGDTLETIRDALVAAINRDALVEAFPAGLFTRIRLRARVAGPEGNGIPISTSVNDGGNVILTATNSTLCCANVAGAPITDENPAIPGETIVVYATGLGLVKGEPALRMKAGTPYDGPAITEPVEFVSSLAGGKTANVLLSTLRNGWNGVYEVHLELNSDLPTNALTQITIAQSYQVSNIFTIPVFNPNAPGN
jgi:uncharacterized protein (TIGR03437 family)